MDQNLLAKNWARNSLLAYAIAQWEGYQPAAHHRLIAQKLEAVESGRIKRLMISVPPRHGKSMLASEFFPAWYLGRNPGKQIIAATYAQDLADDFGRKVRNQIRDGLFSAIFPECVIAADSQAVKRFHTVAGGVYHAVGVGGPITGRGAHLLIVDDPIKGREDADSEAMRRKVKDWYSSVAYTRLMPGGSVIIIQTRWHQADLSGWILRDHDHEDWDVLSLPAIDSNNKPLWPSAYPLHRLQEIKKTIGNRDWSALYQQSPMVDGGNILKSGWWQRWPKSRPLPKFEHVFQSYDTAYSEGDLKTNSYSARSTWGVFRDDKDDLAVMLCESWRDRVDYPDLKKAALASYLEYRPDVVLIEKKASGQSLIQELRRSGLPVKTYMPDKSKVARAYAVQAMLESGRVWAPERRWANSFIDDVAEFPSGESSDWADTCVTPETRIYCVDGVKRIQDIRVGDCVLTHLGRFRTVTAVMRRSVDSLRHLKAKGLDEIKITGNHPVLIAGQTRENRFIPAESVVPREKYLFVRRGKSVSSPRSSSDFQMMVLPILSTNSADAIYLSDWNNDQMIDGEWLNGKHSRSKRVLNRVPLGYNQGWLFGLYLAEGCIADQRGIPARIRISCDEETINKAAEIIRDTFGAMVSLDDNIKAGKVVCRNLTLSRKTVVPLFESFGRLAEHKLIPRWVMEAPIAFVSGFIDGYVKGDGSIYRYPNEALKIRCESVSLGLLHQLRLLLLRMGKSSAICKGKLAGARAVNGQVSVCRDSYVLTWAESKNGYSIGRPVHGGMGYWIEYNEPVLGRFEVMNLSVEEDESYVTTGGAVHNCTQALLYVDHGLYLLKRPDPPVADEDDEPTRRRAAYG